MKQLIGHEGYLRDAYRQYTLKQLAECYKNGEPHITVFASKQQILTTVEGYKSIIADQATEIHYLKKKIQKIDELDSRMKQIEPEKEKRIEPLLSELSACPELQELFNSFFTSFEYKIKTLKGEEPELELSVDEAMQGKEDNGIKVKVK